MLFLVIIFGLARCFISSLTNLATKVLVFLTLYADLCLRRHGLCSGVEEADVYLDRPFVNKTHLFCVDPNVLCMCESCVNVSSKSKSAFLECMHGIAGFLDGRSVCPTMQRGCVIYLFYVILALSVPQKLRQVLPSARTYPSLEICHEMRI